MRETSLQIMKYSTDVGGNIALSFLHYFLTYYIFILSSLHRYLPTHPPIGLYHIN